MKMFKKIAATVMAAAMSLAMPPAAVVAAAAVPLPSINLQRSLLILHRPVRFIWNFIQKRISRV